MQTLAFAAALPLAVALVLLLAFHVHLVLSNKTTIEFQEVRGSCLLASSPGPAINTKI